MLNNINWILKVLDIAIVHVLLETLTFGPGSKARLLYICQDKFRMIQLLVLALPRSIANRAEHCENGLTGASLQAPANGATE
jgi:hypothetical protein